MSQRNWLHHIHLNTETILIAFALAVGCFLHFYRIDQLPMGFYIDESSIGYNAYLISTTGTDEHGVHWPIFFEAFGEYKNPLYIYLLAGLYRLLGFSQWTTRALSAFAWLVGSLYLFLLCRRIFSSHTTRLYIALAISFTPWLFSLSRISFELISLYPLLAIHLYGLYRGFEEDSRWWKLWSGFCMGLCVYAYTTFRLLTLLYALAVLVIYGARRFRTGQYLFTLGATIGVIPYLIYALFHFDNLFYAFHAMTYLNDPTTSFLTKIATFIGYYLGYFGPDFLLTSGDSNLRHHTGFGGEFLTSTVVLLIVSFWIVIKHPTGPFYKYLIVGLIFTPIAAAMTPQAEHSLRAFPMVVFGIVLSAYALQELSLLAARGVVACTALCSLLYVLHYFIVYPPMSADAFENYGFKETFVESLDRSPKRIILARQGDSPYMNLLFFGTLLHADIPLLMGSRNDLHPGDAYIFLDTNYANHRLYRFEVKSSDRIENTVSAKP